MSDIYMKIGTYKNGDTDALLDVIELFNPLIYKYSRMLDGDDTKQDLIIHLIKVIKIIPLESKGMYENKIIFGYIAKSIRNEYIRLSKKSSLKQMKEIELNLEVELGKEEFKSEIELLDLFKVLTEREAYIMKLIYIHYLSVTEVAQYMNISRQAINQSKKRSIKKLYKHYRYLV